MAALKIECWIACTQSSDHRVNEPLFLNSKSPRVAAPDCASRVKDRASDVVKAEYFYGKNHSWQTQSRSTPHS